MTWGRNSTVPIETFGVLAEWNGWDQMLDIWASIQMPKYADQIARSLDLPGNAIRVHYDVDVGGNVEVVRDIDVDAGGDADVDVGSKGDVYQY